MKNIGKFVVVMGVCLLASGAVLAKKPESPGNSGKHKASHHESRERDNDRHNTYFNQNSKSKIQRYYSSHRTSGKCPPGLAKKNNGCRPPGQTKHWKKGARIPQDVEYYDLPHALIHELGRTREGQKLIRVGTDILLIHEATRTVIEAIDDLGRAF